VDEVFEAAALAFRFALGFLFLSASVPKLLAPAEFARAVRNYRLLPSRLNQPVATWLPRIELALAVALLLGVAAGITGAVAAATLIVFAVAVAVNLARGRRIDCGCFTTASPRRIGWGLVVGDVVLAGMAASIAVADPDVLALVPLATATASSISSAEGLALAMVGSLAVLTSLVVSSWLAVRAAARPLDARRGPAVS
jgi:putative oxidoreductase